MLESSSSPWTWPADRVVRLYHWSWFDPGIGKGEVVTGWSQRGETDGRGFLPLEAERGQDGRYMQVYREGFPSVEAHTFSAMDPLPLELRWDDGRPLPWILELLGQG